MKEQRKKLRDLAKMSVFSHMYQAIFAVIMSGFVSTIVLFVYQYNAIEKNVDIFSATPEQALVTLIVTALAALANLPLSFCANRFYLILSRKPHFERATARELFYPFTDPKMIFRGSLIVVFQSLLCVLGVFVLVFPVYFTYCMAIFAFYDNPSLSVFGALKESRRVMKGRKWQAFLTCLPVLLLYLVLNVAFSGFYFLSFFISAIFEALFFVLLAHIYNANKSIQ